MKTRTTRKSSLSRKEFAVKTTGVEVEVGVEMETGVEIRVEVTLRVVLGVVLDVGADFRVARFLEVEVAVDSEWDSTRSWKRRSEEISKKSALGCWRVKEKGGIIW